MKITLASLAMAFCLLSTSVHAQPIPTRDPALQLTPPEPSLFRAQRRQRLLLAAGIGLVASSLAHAAIYTSDACNNDSRASAVAAGAFGVIGVGFTLGGGIALARAQPRHPATRGQKVGAFFLAFGTAVVSQALMMGVWAVQGAGACSS
jgi:hypothetical protein